MSVLRTHAHALLSLLDAELAEALCTQVRLVGGALGPLLASFDQAGAEPDGYAGLGRNARYERLLASEWLLADEAPDEFLRRAAQNEHSFLALSHRAPRALRRCRLLIGTGPDTWGLPRIAMLAVMLALEERARAAGFVFSWSVLGAGQTDHDGISSVADARAFLAARSVPEAPDQPLSELDLSADELWLCGSPQALLHAPRHASKIALAQPWGSWSVDLTLERRHGGRRCLALAMPAEPLCVRLLRDPFGSETSVERPPAVLHGAFAFACRGHRLLTLDERGRVLAYALPSHPDAAPGRSRSFVPQADERLLACTCTDRLIAITAVPGHVLLHGLPALSQHQTQRAGRSVLAIPMDTADSLRSSDWRKGMVLIGKDAQLVALVPLEGDQMLLAGERTQRRAYVVSQRLLGSFQGTRAQQAVWLTQKGSQIDLVGQLPGEASWTSLVSLDVPAPDEVFFCCPRDLSSILDGFVALRTGDQVAFSQIPKQGEWRGFRNLYVPNGATAIGLTVSPHQAPQLVVLEADHKSFSCLGISSAERLLTLTSPVERAEVCPHSRLLAFATRSLWTLFDLTKKRPLAQFARVEEPQ